MRDAFHCDQRGKMGDTCWSERERFSVDKMILCKRSFDYFLLVAKELTLDPSSQRDPSLNTQAFIGDAPLLFSLFSAANPNDK